MNELAWDGFLGDSTSRNGISEGFMNAMTTLFWVGLLLFLLLYVFAILILP